MQNLEKTVQNSDSEVQRKTDERWMREALAEAALGEGGTRPNPPVGCVVVCRDEVLSRAHHEYAGGAHAEAAALSTLVGRDLSAAVLYVTLEPCCTQGRVPPCTEAIIRSGVKRVVVATTDVNPKHAGRGLNRLWESGIDVVSGVCEREAQEMLAPFFKWITTKRPYVSLKMSQSLDGGIADHAGQSKWITSVEARAYVRELRRRADVVLVGCGTVLADNPSLLRSSPSADYRGLPGMRAVLDATGRLPLDAQIFTDGHAEQTIYVTTDQAPEAHRAKVGATGAEVRVLPAEFPPLAGGGRASISLAALVESFGKSGYLNVLCEGGASLASSFVNAGLVDELLLFVAPMILGAGSKRTFGEFPFDLPTAPRFKIDSVRNLGCDLLVRAFPREK